MRGLSTNIVRTLSAPDIAVVVLSVVVFLLIVCGIVLYLIRRRKRRAAKAAMAAAAAAPLTGQQMIAPELGGTPVQELQSESRPYELHGSQPRNKNLQ
jgi:hypothetical protein